MPFPDAKIGKNVAQKIIGSNAPRDFSQMKQSLANVNGHKITGQSHFHTFFYFLDFLQSLQKGIIMAAIGDDNTKF